MNLYDRRGRSPQERVEKVIGGGCRLTGHKIREELEILSIRCFECRREEFYSHASIKVTLRSEGCIAWNFFLPEKSNSNKSKYYRNIVNVRSANIHLIVLVSSIVVFQCNVIGIVFAKDDATKAG